MNGDGNIGSYVVRIIVERNQAMCKTKNEGRFIAIGARLEEHQKGSTKESESHY